MSNYDFNKLIKTMNYFNKNDNILPFGDNADLYLIDKKENEIQCDILESDVNKNRLWKRNIDRYFENIEKKQKHIIDDESELLLFKI